MSRLLRAAAVLIAVAVPRLVTAQTTESLVGRPIVSLHVVSSGRAVQDEQLNSLLALHPGDKLTMKAVRETIQHIMGLRRYIDVRVEAAAEGAGARVDVVLVPLRDVRRVVFRGALGLPEGALRGVIVDRFGATPAVGRSADIARTLEDYYASEGYLQSSVRTAPLSEREVDAGELAFDVDAGTRALIRTLEYRGSPQSVVDSLGKQLALSKGGAYQPASLRRKLDAYAAGLRRDGFFQAKAEATPLISADKNSVDLTIEVTRGPRVSLQFTGDELPLTAREELVPIEREGSVDQDLLEDSERRIRDYLTARGYRDATAQSSVSEAGDQLRVVFAVVRGPLYRVGEDVAIVGADSVPISALKPLLKIVRGQPFVKSVLDTDMASVRTAYLQRGFADVTVTSNVAVSGSSANERSTSVSVNISEGPQFTVRAITFAGRDQLSETKLRGIITSREGMPFYQPALDEDRGRLEDAYLNLGFRRAHVRVDAPMPESGSDIRVRFVIQEGPQVIVDRILVVGNEHVNEATIRRELEIKSGAPLGDEAVQQSKRRLAALGLFRIVDIAELQHGQEKLSDVLVTVEEAPATTLGYGGGVEFQKVETNEFAPRGFFEIGRRNLWGKNRSVNLFSRVSFRRHGSTDSSNPVLPPVAVTLTNLEYRVIGSYREPRFLGSRGDLQVSGVFEQGSRTSFRYRRRSARIDFGERLGRGWSLLAQYSFERNEVFDDLINAIDRPLIDRLFPQVRLSVLSVSGVRDTRDDPLDPGKGELISLSGDLALRQIGSQVGLAKSFAQAFAYRKLPTARRIVVAAGARLGMGTGFPRVVALTTPKGFPITGPDGQPVYVTVRDLPANERFFAGGDTTVRGFQLDRLGRPDTFDRDGVPIGGHAEIVLNAEVRMAVWREFGVVGFVDYGNVFSQVTDLSVAKLRGSAGFGIRYKSPVGPLRVDLGFKLGTLQTFGTYNEGRMALHISIGQAF